VNFFEKKIDEQLILKFTKLNGEQFLVLTHSKLNNEELHNTKFESCFESKKKSGVI
jgi:hypothetical protein